MFHKVTSGVNGLPLQRVPLLLFYVKHWFILLESSIIKNTSNRKEKFSSVEGRGGGLGFFRVYVNKHEPGH